MFDASILHGAWSLWFNYFWPSLKGNGPEALVQTVVYGGIAVLLVPVVRRFMRAEAERARKIANGELVEVEADVKKIEALALRLRRWLKKRI